MPRPALADALAEQPSGSADAAVPAAGRQTGQDLAGTCVQRGWGVDAEAVHGDQGSQDDIGEFAGDIIDGVCYAFARVVSQHTDPRTGGLAGFLHHFEDTAGQLVDVTAVNGIKPHA